MYACNYELFIRVKYDCWGTKSSTYVRYLRKSVKQFGFGLESEVN